MLVKNGHIVDDSFMNVPDSEALPPAGAIIVSLKRFLAEREALALREAPLGVRLESQESPEPLGEYVRQLSLVVLVIPTFKDGRAFSWARLLRTRLGYTGEIRVTGHFLRDQLAFFRRVGVDAFDLSQNLSTDDIAAALREISNVYQPSVDGRTTIRELRAARRRA
jgi:uncharacterized protein (DUF934 family)